MIPLKDIGVRMIQKSVTDYFPTSQITRYRRTKAPKWSMTFNIPGSETKIKAHFVKRSYAGYYHWKTMTMEIQFSFGYRSELSKLNDSKLGVFVFKEISYDRDSKVL